MHIRARTHTNAHPPYTHTLPLTHTHTLMNVDMVTVSVWDRTMSDILSARRVSGPSQRATPVAFF